MSGSLAIGPPATLILGRVLDPARRLLLGVGFPGGYATFGPFAFESVALLESGRRGAVLAPALGSDLLRLLAGAVGIVLGRARL